VGVSSQFVLGGIVNEFETQKFMNSPLLFTKVIFMRKRSCKQSFT
jgi:hypothetical protein